MNPACCPACCPALPCPVQTRVAAEQKAYLCLMHPSFAAHPRHFKFRPGRMDKDTCLAWPGAPLVAADQTLPGHTVLGQCTDMGGAGPGQVETSSRANCRRGPLPRDKEVHARSPMSCRQIYHAVCQSLQGRQPDLAWGHWAHGIAWLGWQAGRPNRGASHTFVMATGDPRLSFNVMPKTFKLTLPRADR